MYYNQPSIVAADAFVITCSITGPPHRPPPPRALMLAAGGMLDDPTYSDVTFVLPRGRTVCAMKKMLARRAAYFESMFSSGFIEAQSDTEGADSEGLDGAEELEDDSDYEDDGDAAQVPAADGADAFEHESEPNSPRRDREEHDTPDEDVEELALSDAPSEPQVPQPIPPQPQPQPTRIERERGPRKARVVVRGSAYSTYRALLYYVSHTRSPSVSI